VAEGGEGMNSELYARFRLEELITQREGMIAENKQREAIGNSMAYSEDSFLILAAQIRELADKL
jgi:hypothetical protein